jgi:serine/threonine protein kinase
MRPLPEYELIRKLGSGGFGEVWQAEGPGGFHVALKFIRLNEPASKPELRSIEVMKDIRHPNLLSLFGAWQSEGLLIVAMELGVQTLVQRLQDALHQGHTGIPSEQLLEYMRDAAKGLDYLHSRGIQHRDVKPHNLLLVGGGVKVADFGLAKLLQHQAISQTMSLTPAYAAPEFFLGVTDSQSDQYGLAVSYCQLRGARLPFTGNREQLMIAHTEGDPDLTMLPEEERAVVARALSKDPKERWPTCRAFVEELGPAMLGDKRSEDILGTRTVQFSAPLPRPAPPPARTHWLWLALVALLLVLPLVWLLLAYLGR